MSGVRARYGTAGAAPFHPTPAPKPKLPTWQQTFSGAATHWPSAFEFRRVVFSLQPVPSIEDLASTRIISVNSGH